MSISKISSAFAVALLASAGMVDAICTSLPARTGVGRGSSAYDDKSGWCTTQIEVCGLICVKNGGQVKENTCSIQSNTAGCYECSCTFPGVGEISPDLTPYGGTIPAKSCAQLSFNCWSAPGGGVNNNCEERYQCGERELEGYDAEPPVPIPGVPTELQLPVTRSTYAQYVNTWTTPSPAPTPEPAVVVETPATTSVEPVAVAPEPLTSSTSVAALPASTTEIISTTSTSTISTSSALTTSTSVIISTSSLNSTLSTITSTAFSNSTISSTIESVSTTSSSRTTRTRTAPTGTLSALPTNDATRMETFLGGSVFVAGMMALL